MILLELLDGIETVAADVADRNARSFSIFVRDLHEVLAAFLVKLGNAQTQHLPFGGRAQAEIGIDDCLLHGLDHRLVPNLHRQQPRLGHADGRELVQRHVGAIGIDLHRFQHRSRGAAGTQAAQLMLESLGGALHAAFQFVDVERTGGHNALPPEISSSRLSKVSRERWPA